MTALGTGITCLFAGMSIGVMVCHVATTQHPPCICRAEPATVAATEPAAANQWHGDDGIYIKPGAVR